MVDFGFLTQNVGPIKAFCCSVNVDEVVILLGVGGDPSTLQVITELV